MTLSYARIQQIKGVVASFRTQRGKVVDIEVASGGRINDTYKVIIRSESGAMIPYSLQNVNERVFKDIDGMMRNIISTTEYQRKHGYRTMMFTTTINGEHVFKRPEENWRLYEYQEANVKQSITNLEDMYSLGSAVSQFHLSTEGMDPTVLIETIPDFHNTILRLERFKTKVIQMLMNEAERQRVLRASEQIEFILKHEAEAGVIVKALTSGTIPVSVTHNDPKLNNVLFDQKTGKVLYMIDLDTVMPGSRLYDIGDAIRYAANTAGEDEKNLDEVSLDLELYKEFLKGYKNTGWEYLTVEERKLIPMSVKLMALELGTRFIHDYLDGNKYFRRNDPLDNWYSGMVQLRLVQDIDGKTNQMERIVHEI